MKTIKVLVVATLCLGFSLFPAFLAQADSASTASSSSKLPQALGLAGDNILYLHITAYSSDVNQTDDTPFITANGTYVHDGIVATNLLPFGTKIQIPSLFGGKIFIVEDRMAPKMTGRMDIWMSSREKAINFGSNYANVVILNQPTSSLALAVK